MDTKLFSFFRPLLIGAAALIWTVTAQAQDTLMQADDWARHPALAGADFSRADATAINFKERYADASDLGRKLTADLDSDLEKARAIFTWIAFNISYDCKKFKQGAGPIKFSGDSQASVMAQRQQWRAEQLARTLKRKQGVCQDYSELFVAMAAAAGLEAVFIGGNARRQDHPFSSRLGESHAWNAVKIDGQWGLLDATWAAGKTKDGCSKFVQVFSPGFFLTPPAWFALNHLPKEEKWQLLETPITAADFEDRPVINYGQAVYALEGFSMQLEPGSEEEGQLRIRLKFAGSAPDLRLQTSTGRPIPFRTSEDESGYLALSFSAPRASSLTIFGMDSPKAPSGTWLAKYKLP